MGIFFLDGACATTRLRKWAKVMGRWGYPWAKATLPSGSCQYVTQGDNGRLPPPL